MKQKLQIVYIILIILCIATISVTAGSKTRQTEDQLVTEISSLVAKHQNEKIAALWNDLHTKGYVARVGSDEELRYQFVMLQGIVEESICNLLKNKHLLKSKIAIITPKPPNPLRKTKSEIQKEKAAVQTEAERLALETIEYRNNILVNQYLAKKLGILIAVYNKAAGLTENTYQKLVEKYRGNLIDKPVVMHMVAEKPSGAKYKLIDKYNNDIFVSFQSYQFLYQDQSKKSNWAIWFGYPKKDSVIAARQQFVDDYLHSIGVSEFDIKN